jgi:hypothetical protein
MSSFVYRPGHHLANENGMVDRALLEAEYERGEAPNVISDIMDPTRHMCDNQLYTSKAKFRETTRAHGCVEVGNETATLLKQRQHVPLSREKRREDIQRAIYDIRNGNRR